MIKILRTPEKAFENLPEYPWEPNYIELDSLGLRMHYLDEGPQDGEVLLLVHGVPTWSFIFRKMIPIFVASGYRVIVPDLIGFGKSDKPENSEDITFDTFNNWFEAFVLQLNLSKISGFFHDWGGIVILRMMAKYPDLFSRISLGNTFFPTGSESLNPTFKTWKSYLKSIPKPIIGNVIEMGSITNLGENICSAYNAPFPSEKYKTVLKKLPFLIPMDPENEDGKKNQVYWNILSTLPIRIQTIFTKNDPITVGWENLFQERLLGSLAQPHQIISRTSHFYQEDHPQLISQYLLEFLRANPL